MTDIAVITRVTKTENGKNPKWPVLLFLHCETENGPMLLRMTGEAANGLRALLDKAPPNIGARPDLKKFEGG